MTYARKLDAHVHDLLMGFYPRDVDLQPVVRDWSLLRVLLGAYCKPRRGDWQCGALVSEWIEGKEKREKEGGKGRRYTRVAPCAEGDA